MIFKTAYEPIHDNPSVDQEFEPRISILEIIIGFEAIPRDPWLDEMELLERRIQPDERHNEMYIQQELDRQRTAGETELEQLLRERMP